MAGAGSRFRLQGYNLPKPLLPVEGNTMVVQAVKCLPPASQSIFICLNEHLCEYPIEQTLLSNFLNTKVLEINHVTEGQACTCEIGISQCNINSDAPLLISACDNGAYYNVEKFYKLIDDQTIDVIVWSFTNNATSKLYPHMYAWLDVDINGSIKDVSIKKPFTDRNSIHCIIGTMYFRKTSIYLE